ncbi:MAG: hypothetical protein KJ718_05535 [Nanoarchaeota archaeon]|nr:hypothetical protein [Nanoarchaeota archaeon]MBU1051985.1 hypothetical protein [Nanoarchaeota archaeon]MBU1988257.1 hypothetical protein [Nanoarchaeota archaeon]
MAEKEQILKEKVEHSGLFDFSSLYSFAHSWFKEGQFGVNEEKYAEKTSGSSRDIDVEWNVTKDVTDYFKFEYKVKFEAKGLTDVEVEIDGEKKAMNKGKLSVEITGTLILDRDSKWDSSPFSRFMRDVYNKYIIPSRVNNMKGELGQCAKGFKEEVKAFLEMVGRQ